LGKLNEQAESSFSYTWEITDKTERTLFFKIDPSNPKSISSGSIDKLMFKIVKPDMLKSKEGIIMTNQNLETKIILLPPFLSEEEEKNIEKIAKGA
jgi:hypothetical protein